MVVNVIAPSGYPGGGYQGDNPGGGYQGGNPGGGYQGGYPGGAGGGMSALNSFMPGGAQSHPQGGVGHVKPGKSGGLMAKAKTFLGSFLGGGQKPHGANGQHGASGQHGGALGSALAMIGLGGKKQGQHGPPGQPGQQNYGAPMPNDPNNPHKKPGIGDHIMGAVMGFGKKQKHSTQPQAVPTQNGYAGAYPAPQAAYQYSAQPSHASHQTPSHSPHPSHPPPSYQHATSGSPYDYSQMPTTGEAASYYYPNGVPPGSGKH